MEKIRLVFYECEHQEDLDNYMKDVQDCGGTIFSQFLDTDNEEGTVEIEVENLKEFTEKFVNTKANEFSDYV